MQIVLMLCPQYCQLFSIQITHAHQRPRLTWTRLTWTSQYTIILTQSLVNVDYFSIQGPALHNY